MRGKKRTPQSAFDPAAGKDIYEPERIVAERLAKSVSQFHVKWVSFEPKHNTWEPIASPHPLPSTLSPCLVSALRAAPPAELPHIHTTLYPVRGVRASGPTGGCAQQ